MDDQGTALSRPLLLADGRCLRTLADAGKMIVSLGLDEQAQPRWQALAQTLIAEIRTGQTDHVAVITAQIERALSEPPFGSVRLAERKALAHSVDRAPDYGAVASSEFLSILAVALTAGMIALALP
jgi:hypothetical protein